MAKYLKNLSRSEIHDIACRYAYGRGKMTLDMVAEEFGLKSGNVASSAIKKAVIEYIVDMDTIYGISNRAADNAEEHAGDPGRRHSEEYYRGLIRERNLFHFSDKQIKSLINAYLEYAGGMHFFSSKVKVQQDFLAKEFRRAIETGIVSDDIVDKMEEKALKGNDPEKVRLFFRVMRARRDRAAQPEAPF